MDDPNIGKEVGGYRIENVLGRGGMGVVYKAEDIELAKKVALKVIDPSMARNEYFMRQFRREGRSLARIYSPHIVAVHALRQTELGLTLVMEYVDGNTLKDRIGRGALETREALRICREMLLAFKDAHGVDVIHRDVKPANIMLTRDGTVKVTDFGLAKVHDPSSATTVTMGVAGTLYYMSPEQVKGLKDVDRRTDLYSIGMTMYEMVTGRLPFEKTDGTFTIQKRIAEERLDPPNVHKKDLPKALVRFIARSLEKDRDRRFQSAEEMLIALEQVEAALVKKGRERQARTGKKRSKQKPGRRIWPTVVGSFAVLLAVVAMWVYIITRPPPETGTLSLESIPEGATILVDGSEIGIAPQVLSDLPVKSVSLTFQLEGYVSSDTVVVVRAGATEQVTVALEPQMPGVLTGRVRFTSTPSGATIFVDDETRGNTPVTLDSVLAGSRRVVLQMDGYLPDERIVEVLPASLVNVGVQLQQEGSPTGSLRITTNPPGAVVRVDGVRRGTAPNTVRDLRPGSYTVAIRHDGFRPTQRQVTVRPDATETVSFQLVPVQPPVSAGRLEVTSEPPGADVLVDGQPRGQTFLAVEEIPSGSHQVIIRMSGYRDREVSVTVGPDETVRIDETLDPLTGTVQIRVIPWAEVYVDAKKVLEEVDAVSRSVSVSANVRHRFDVSNPDLGAKCTRWLEVSPDRTLQVSINLTESVKVSVISIDDGTDTAFPGAQIFVDGQPTGRTTPLPVDFISGCSYEVTLVMEGYESGPPTRVMIEDGGEAPVAIRLTKGE